MPNLVSVIVPIYNVENYLNKCIKSIVSQTYSNIEIILVDDGATDNCPGMCDNWAKKDDRIKVIHKNNGGLASARNAGMDIMSGDLFMFIDSDDYIDQDMIQCMVEGYKNNAVDVICCGIQKVFLDTDTIERDKYVPGTYKQQEAIRHLLLWDGFVRSYACGKLYRTKNYGDIRFLEELKYGEDTPFVYEVLKRSKRICQLPEIKYNYLQRNDSLVGNTYSHKKLLTIKAAQIVSDKCKKDFPELQAYADYHVAMDCYFIMNRLIMSGSEKEYCQDFRLLNNLMKKYSIFLIIRFNSLKKGIYWGILKYYPKAFRLKKYRKKPKN